MSTLIVGASGATGKKLVQQLLNMGQAVKVIVRPSSRIPDTWNNNDQVTIIRGNIHAMRVDEMAEYLQDCQAVASCLGHNLTWKGIYGQPRKLVTDAVGLICDAITQNAPEVPVKLVLMNTTGNQNRDLSEPLTLGERIVFGLIRVLVPPHPDNEQAADHLRVKVGQHHDFIRWVVVRPDSLIDEDQVTTYTSHPSPTRSAVFNPGKTSRMNVGHFMATLMVNREEWDQWEGQMPVIYNTAPS